MRKATVLIALLLITGCSGIGWNLAKYDSDKNIFISEYPELKVRFLQKPIYIGETSYASPKEIITLTVFVIPEENKKASICTVTRCEYAAQLKSHQASLSEFLEFIGVYKTKDKGEIQEAVVGVSQEAISDANVILSSAGYDKIYNHHEKQLVYGYFKFISGADISVLYYDSDSYCSESSIKTALKNRAKMSSALKMELYNTGLRAERKIEVTE